ncbi:hypothetical protein I6N90_21715 [Paenibacillus sp. GSMTC-2017]|uniref:hypothetical protein n=1 Tax=Paenibacillus sp. GSMTC-2017 TaxID=2794350 RepID=UPI0018D7A53C|nr:hypothetical protein [Paenibacillus sp. GSMTC-2017]MBH5320415.1 hypothetical protein [Paenibacillus sp. GSMTC-2017]
MSFQFGFSSNLISMVLTVISLGIILFYVARHYRKLLEKPAIWRVVLVTFIGLFSLSFTITMFGTAVKLSVLPLGVWIVYFLLKNTSWQTYRKFAWLGFWSNFLFLGATLLSVFVHNGIYPKDEVATYIADVEQATILEIHPSATFATFDKEIFNNELNEIKPSENIAFEWYQWSRQENEPFYQNEHFPYMLIGSKSSLGSGLKATIYIEADGKGLLISDGDKQYYYRSEQPLIEVEVKER